MKQPDTTTSGINGIEMELMLNPIKAQLDDMDKKINALCEVTLAWNESIDNINRHLTESMDLIKEEIGISSWVDDSDALIDIDEFIFLENGHGTGDGDRVMNDHLKCAGHRVGAEVNFGKIA